MVEERASRFRLPRLRVAALGLVLLGVCSCGGSSKERGGSAGDPDAGASGEAGLGGASQGGSAPTGGTAPTGGAGSSSGGAGAMGGDGGVGGENGGSDAGGSGGRSGAGDGGAGGASGRGGGASGAGGSGGSAGASGAGGSGVTYATCQFGSGIARIVVAKRDPARDRCVILVLTQPGSNTLGLALPMSWGVESAFYSMPASGECLIRGPASGAVAADSGSGTVTRATGFIIDVDVTLNFAGGVMEDLEATGLDASRGCPF